MRELNEWIVELTGIRFHKNAEVLITLLIISLIILIRKVIMKFVSRKTDNPHSLYQWRKISAYTSFVIGGILLWQIWFEGFKDFSTFLGLLSAGLAIALKDLIENLAAWVFIVWRKPLVVGERVQVGEFRGDVIDIRVFQFSLMEIGNWVDADQSTGRIINVPNGRIFKDVQANYSKGFEFIWDEIGVLITFESDWKKAENILKEIVNKHAVPLTKQAEAQIRKASQKFLIFYNILTPTVYVTVKDSGVMLTMRFLCQPRQRRGMEQQIWKNVLEEFAKHDNIDFAYPTTRFYANNIEGKSGTKPVNVEKKAQKE